jgi:hypothetical protein
MSCILYYSNFCEPSKKLLQTISKTQNVNNIHFICIDKRVKDANGKIYIILQTGQKILMPENVTKVPALLLLNQNYKVIYGDDIYRHLKPQVQQQMQQATKNNMEPINYQDGFSTFGGFSGGIVSDNYSFLDQSDSELSVKGDGGLRQMHNYVLLNESSHLSMKLPQDDADYKGDKLKEGETSIEALKRKRDEELNNISYKSGNQGPSPSF